MTATTAILVALALAVALLVPYLIYSIRRGKAEGHGAETWCKPAGHGDIGPDTGRGVGGVETHGPTAMSNECAEAVPDESADERAWNPPRRRSA